MDLRKKVYPCLQENKTSPLVLLHGWAFDSRIWQDLIKPLQAFTQVITLDLPGFGDNHEAWFNDEEDICKKIVQTMPPHAIYAGWSLGGMLVTKIAAMFPERVAGIITLATSISFIERKGWTQGMDIAEFQDFYNAVEKDPKRALKRFYLLVSQGDQLARQQLGWLQNIVIQAEDYCNLLPTLSLLRRINNCDDIHRLRAPGLHIFGEQDRLVPLSVAQKLTDSSVQYRNHRQQCNLLKKTGHLVFWPSERVTLSIKDFLTELH